jgi:hypothetical protein
VFVDDKLEPLPDQWAFLSKLHRLSSSEISAILAKAEADMPGGLVGVRLPVEDENADEPWKLTPSRRRQAPPAKGPLPDLINVVLADQVYIDRTGLPPSLVAQLVRIAAFQNPEFYRAQAMRLPTYGKPMIISCAELHPRHVALPRKAAARYKNMHIHMIGNEEGMKALGVTSKFNAELFEHLKAAGRACAARWLEGQSTFSGSARAWRPGYVLVTFFTIVSVAASLTAARN